MNTIRKDKWPEWVRKIVGEKKGIEIKEQGGRYYAYEARGFWDKERKRPAKTSRYLGAVKECGIKAPFEPALNGIYEYGHVRLAWHAMEKGGLIRSLKKIFPVDWESIAVFALNRLIDPRPIKSIGEWQEKTYLARKCGMITPKKMSRVLETIGLSWKSQLEFFATLKRDGEKILYDGSVIFSSSGENPILETGYNKDHLLLPKANIVLAFSHERFLPVFMRVIPGSVHEIKTIEILSDDLGSDIILVMDRGFNSKTVRKKISLKSSFIMPLKRNSKLIDYARQPDSYFVYRDRPIKCTSYKADGYVIYLYEDVMMKAGEEKTYLLLRHRGKKRKFHAEQAGKIALISNRTFSPKDAFEMWKSRDSVEKSFNVLQNMLDTDRPYVRREETFRGYLFASFIGLAAYYLVMKMLKDAGINDKVSVSDALLELSKIYVVDMGKKELLSERTKSSRELAEKLGLANLYTKIGWS